MILKSMESAPAATTGHLDRAWMGRVRQTGQRGLFAFVRLIVDDFGSGVAIGLTGMDGAGVGSVIGEAVTTGTAADGEVGGSAE